MIFWLSPYATNGSIGTSVVVRTFSSDNNTARLKKLRRSRLLENRGGAGRGNASRAAFPAMLTPFGTIWEASLDWLMSGLFRPRRKTSVRRPA